MLLSPPRVIDMSMPKLPGLDTRYSLGAKIKAQEVIREMNIHGDSRRGSVFP